MKKYRFMNELNNPKLYKKSSFDIRSACGGKVLNKRGRFPRHSNPQGLPIDVSELGRGVMN